MLDNTRSSSLGYERAGGSLGLRCFAKRPIHKIPLNLGMVDLV